MKLKVENVVQSKDPIGRLIKERMSAAIAFRIQRLVRLLEPQLLAYQGVWKMLLQKYGKEVEPGTITVDAENIEAYQMEYAELMGQEFEIEWWPIPISTLDGALLSPEDAYLMSFMFTEE